MLTRLEIDGFKSLQNVTIDFDIMTCITGANGSGKSNIFDAIEFLGLLASLPIEDAAEGVRGGYGHPDGPLHLLTRSATGSPPASDGYRPMRLAAEMILPTLALDEFGQWAKPAAAFVRYEIELSARRTDGRLAVKREALLPIKRSYAQVRLRLLNKHDGFLKAVLRQGQRTRGMPCISTDDIDGEPLVSVHRDRGRAALEVRAESMPNTAVKAVRGSDYPTVLAARREMQSWRRLALNPAAISKPDTYEVLARINHGVDALPVARDGGGLAALLHASASASGQPEKVYGSVADRLNTLVGAEACRVFVNDDEMRHRLTLMVESPQGDHRPVRTLSDGTLRFLALCVLPEVATTNSLHCIEHPESGIHPGNAKAVAEVLGDLTVDSRAALSPSNPLNQAIITTHSDPLCRALERDGASLMQVQDGQIAATIRAA